MCINEDESCEATQDAENNARMQQVKEQDSVFALFRDSRFRLNTLILTLLWSTSSYSFYFTEFYMKYVPVQNVYYLALLMGCSDLMTTGSFNLVKRFITTKQILILGTLFLSISSLTLSISLFATNPSDIASIAFSMQVFFSVMVFGMRFFSGLTFVAVYFANGEYFPTLLKGAIFAVTNVAARLATVLSPLVAELMGNPSVTVALFGVAACFSAFRLVKPTETKAI